MIDLSYKPRKPKQQQEQEPPMIVTLIALTPFAFLLWVLLTGSFLHGIF